MIKSLHNWYGGKHRAPGKVCQGIDFPSMKSQVLQTFRLIFGKGNKFLLRFLRGTRLHFYPGASERFYHKNLLSIYLRLAVIAAVRKDWEGKSECLTTTNAERRPARSIVLAVMAIV
jgi:hypothetical protein